MRPPLEPRFEERATGRAGRSLRGLVGGVEGGGFVIDPEGVREALGEAQATGRTIVQGIARSTTALAAPPSASPRPLWDALEQTLGDLPSGRVALAVSGGLDSALLWAALGDRAQAFTLATRLPGYCEVDDTLALARHLGLDLEVVEASADDVVEAAPRAVLAAETPLYNLHPVARLLLAERIRAAGFDVLVTGDGADEVCRGETGEDYLPIVGALMLEAGLEPVAPLLDDRVRAAMPRHPAKRALRELALRLGVPSAHAERPKTLASRPRWRPRVACSTSRSRAPSPLGWAAPSTSRPTEASSASAPSPCS